MTVYLSKHPQGIQLQARAEADGAVGDLTIQIRPGESALGRSYAEWDELPEGPHEVSTDGHP